MRCERFEDAIASFQKARSLLPQHSRAHLYVAILLSQCHLHRQDMVAARTIVEELKEGPLSRALQSNPHQRGYFNYLCSCIAYFDGDYQSAWRHLQESQDANLGKETWLTAIRLFEVMLLIDKDQGDLASQKMENLRKHLARYNTPQRMRSIYKLLAAQERQAFSFGLIANEEQELRRLREELLWDSVGQEIVRFEDWYLDHRKRATKK
jgi:tetratricopeptide (TPR) repeat protein